MEKTTSGAAHTTSQRQEPQPQRGGLMDLVSVGIEHSGGRAGQQEAGWMAWGPHWHPLP